MQNFSNGLIVEPFYKMFTEEEFPLVRKHSASYSSFHLQQLVIGLLSHTSTHCVSSPFLSCIFFKMCILICLPYSAHACAHDVKYTHRYTRTHSLKISTKMLSPIKKNISHPPPHFYFVKLITNVS